MTEQAEEFSLHVTVRWYGGGTAEDAARALVNYRDTFNLRGCREAEIIDAKPVCGCSKVREEEQALSGAPADETVIRNPKIIWLNALVPGNDPRGGPPPWKLGTWQVTGSEIHLRSSGAYLYIWYAALPAVPA